MANTTGENVGKGLSTNSVNLSAEDEGVGSSIAREIHPARGPLSDSEWYAQLVQSGVSPLIAQAQLKHRRDLPELLVEHQGGWVAYRGDTRLEIGRSKTALYRKYLDDGIDRRELLVLCVEPDLFEDDLQFALPA